VIPPLGAVVLAVAASLSHPHVPDRAPHAVVQQAPRPPTVALEGRATWYAWRTGQAAAGPALRAFLGPRWRGMTVLVNGVPVRLTDYMGTTNRAKVIDLDDDTFRTVCGPLSMGVCDVTVRW